MSMTTLTRARQYSRSKWEPIIDNCLLTHNRYTINYVLHVYGTVLQLCIFEYLLIEHQLHVWHADHRTCLHLQSSIESIENTNSFIICIIFCQCILIRLENSV